MDKVIFLDVEGVLNNGTWTIEMNEQGVCVYKPAGSPCPLVNCSPSHKHYTRFNSFFILPEQAVFSEKIVENGHPWTSADKR